MNPENRSGVRGQFETERHQHGDRFSGACVQCLRDALRDAFRYVPDATNIQAGEAGERISALRRRIAGMLDG